MTRPFDAARMRWTRATPAPPHPLPGLKHGELFLKGPISWRWLTMAGALPGRALQVGVALWHRAGLERSGRVMLPTSQLRSMGVDRYAANRGLRALERAALVSVRRPTGRAPRVTLLDAPVSEPSQERPA